MNYYWFNRQEILQKAKEKYSKEKEAIKEKSIKSVIKTCHKKKKTRLKSIKKIQKLVQYKKNK